MDQTRTALRIVGDGPPERLAPRHREGARGVQPSEQKDVKPTPSRPPSHKRSPDRLALQHNGTAATPKQSHEEKKRVDAEARKKSRALQARQQRIESLESRIAETEAAIREIEQQMSAPGFYDDRAAAQPVIDRHQALMWQVGDLMNQWEELQSLKEA